MTNSETLGKAITFDKILVSTGVGELDASSGIFTCRQTGEQITSPDIL